MKKKGYSAIIKVNKLNKLDMAPLFEEKKTKNLSLGIYIFFFKRKEQKFTFQIAKSKQEEKEARSKKNYNISLDFSSQNLGQNGISGRLLFYKLSKINKKYL